MSNETPVLFFDLKQLSEAAQQASHNAREDARRRGISFVYLRNGRIIREMPNGRKKVIARLNATPRISSSPKL